jgi:hypothetical protein
LFLVSFSPKAAIQAAAEDRDEADPPLRLLRSNVISMKR